MSSGPFAFDPVPLTPDLATYYRNMLQVHTGEPGADRCPVCRVPRCQDAQFAWVQLVCAGDLYEPVVDPADAASLRFVFQVDDQADDTYPSQELPRPRRVLQDNDRDLAS
ncbi:hypothetical protein GCM10009682_16110 [Luedemannella flava]|uniref:Uncharacterized protein n=1 Tax=Luedemannella flava TaxID=349316 RepID=A0ABN2LNU1_9ACTN